MSRAGAAPTETRVPLPGDIIAGKYEIVRLLAEGGMGIVYEAHHLRLDHRVAIKVLHVDEDVPDSARRFEREARAVAQLAGRHVAKVYDVDTLESGRPFMVMEYLQGWDLEMELSYRGALPVEEAVGWVIEVCAAMSEAHQLGIVHRDLKPANLFLSEVSGGRIVKVVDFGISKSSRDEASMTITQSTFGTPHYMSPEQVRSAKHVDGRSDIWSLGVILYEMLAADPPFPGDTASAVIAAIAADAPVPLGERAPHVPEGLCAAVMKALSKDPADRFQTVDAFAEAIAPHGPHPDARSVSHSGPISSGVRIVTAAPEEPSPPPTPSAEPVVLPLAPPQPKWRRAVAAFVILAAAIVAAVMTLRPGQVSEPAAIRESEPLTAVREPARFPIAARTSARSRSEVERPPRARQRARAMAPSAAPPSAELPELPPKPAPSINPRKFRTEF